MSVFFTRFCPGLSSEFPFPVCTSLSPSYLPAELWVHSLRKITRVLGPTLCQCCFAGINRTWKRGGKKEMVSAVHQVTRVGECYQHHWGHFSFYSRICCLNPIWHKTQRGKEQDAGIPAKWLACFIITPRISTQLSSLNIYWLCELFNLSSCLL